MKEIELAFDYQIFMRQKMGGISRVFYEVNKRLEAKDEFLLRYPLKFSKNYYFKERFHLSVVSSKSLIINYLLRIYNKIIFVVFLLFHRECNIVHPTYYSSYFYYFLPSKTKYVLTVHDCIHELYLKKSIGNMRICYLKKKAIKRADAIIVPSENTKKDVLSIYSIDEKKIHVVNWGTTPILLDNEYIRTDLPDRYILYVGARNDYKNFKNFILAVKGVCNIYKDIEIVCIGGGVFSKSEKEYLEMHRLSERFMQIDMDDDGLMYAYRKAICFVYPSYYEGFGIPILEAFENKCPVALSNSSCFPEVGGDAVLYFDPNNVCEMRDCILKLVEDADLRDSMIKKGTHRLKQFSWESTVEKVVEVYKQVSNS